MRLHVERHDRLAAVDRQPARELGGLSSGERHLLAQLDGREMVRDADERRAS